MKKKNESSTHSSFQRAILIVISTVLVLSMTGVLALVSSGGI